jgi:hypothetical protein
MNSSDNDQFMEEFNDLKKYKYKTDRKGFNEDDGLFYTGRVEEKDGKVHREEVFYRDESDNVSLHLIDARTKRHAGWNYLREGKPLNLDDPPLNSGGSGKGRGKKSSNKREIVSSTPNWNALTVNQLKYFLRKNGLVLKGNKDAIIQRLIDNNIEYNLEDIEQGDYTSTTHARKISSTKNNTRKKQNTKKRKNTDYNAFELVMALILRYNIQNAKQLHDLIRHGRSIHSGIETDIESYDNYVIDLSTRSVNMLNHYITTFHRNNNRIYIDNIDRVQLQGKGGDKNEKSDVFFTYENDITRYGVSVKQSREATLSNYSVASILDEITGSKQLSKELHDIKMEYISNAGLVYNNKSDRALIGGLFHNHFENPYWNQLRSVIQQYSRLISNNILNSVFCINSGTVVYEYDGSTLSLFENTCYVPGTSNIIEDRPYYTLENRTQRKAAKMFYNIYIGNELKYRVEIRHKGSWSTSPQFMLFKPG